VSALSGIPFSFKVGASTDRFDLWVNRELGGVGGGRNYLGTVIGE
jgi:hypothetical protein